MKKAFILFSLFLLLISNSFGQVPQGMNYQAVVHDNLGNVIPNQLVGFKFNIHQGSAGGTIVYSETHADTSDQFGGVSLVIGHGTIVSGNFSTINWSSGIYFNEVLLDVTGGTNYVSMGSSQLMSVPYALYANSAGTTATPSTTDYKIKFNGVDIRDSSLNFVSVGGRAYLTKYNYFFYTVNSNGFVSISPVTDSLQEFGEMYTSDTINQSPVYSEANYYSLGRVFKIQGRVQGGSYLPNHAGELYYVPLNSIPVTLTLFNYWTVTGHWVSTSGQFYQAFPNNPTVTGYNLPNTFTVKYER